MKNITKGWRTTSVGIVILIASLSSVYLKDINWTDASVGMLIGVGLIFSPDAFIKKKL